QRLAAEPFPQVAAARVLDGDVRHPLVLADIVDLDHVRVLKLRDGHRLASEPGQVLLPGQRASQQHLERHGSIQVRLPGLVDHAPARSGFGSPVSWAWAEDWSRGQPERWFPPGRPSAWKPSHPAWSAEWTAEPPGRWEALAYRRVR